jgi:hypothetical protein
MTNRNNELSFESLDTVSGGTFIGPLGPFLPTTTTSKPSPPTPTGPTGPGSGTTYPSAPFDPVGVRF